MIINDFYDGKHIESTVKNILSNEASFRKLTIYEKHVLMHGNIQDYFVEGEDAQSKIDVDALKNSLHQYTLINLQDIENSIQNDPDSASYYPSYTEEVYLFFSNKNGLKKEFDILVPSVFESLYYEMKQKDIITKATSSHIAFSNLQELSSISVEKVNFTHNLEEATSVIKSYGALLNNNKVIAKYCNELEEENRRLVKENIDLQQRLNNRNISSWA